LASHATGGRKLGIGGFVGLVVAYLIILQGLPWLVTTGDLEYGKFPDAGNLWLSLVVPVAVSVAFVAGLITWLGWWQRVIHEGKRVQRWVWIVPALMVLAAVVATDYANLIDVELGLSLGLVVAVLLVGTGEELMFRGVGVNVFRGHGMTEGKVALWSSVAFGLSHLTNVITEGPGAFGQAFVTALLGYGFYLVLRVSGIILVPILVHALWDFGLFSSNIGPDAGVYGAAGITGFVTLVLVVILFIRRHKIEPDAQPDAPAGHAAPTPTG
jgi:hypothetical protein